MPTDEEIVIASNTVINCANYCDHGCAITINPDTSIPPQVLAADWVVSMWTSPPERHGEVPHDGDLHQLFFCDINCMLQGWLKKLAHGPDGQAIMQLAHSQLSAGWEDHSGTVRYVLAFARLMEYKMSLNRHKGDRPGWMAKDSGTLFNRIGAEYRELSAAYFDWEAWRNHPDDRITPAQITAKAIALAKECADVANQCMELADRVGGTQAALAHHLLGATYYPTGYEEEAQ